MRVPDRHVEHPLTLVRDDDLGTRVEEAFVGLSLDAFDEIFEWSGDEHGPKVPRQPLASASRDRATAEIWISSVPA